MRLIDADAFKQQVTAYVAQNNIVTSKGNAMCDLIDKQPTVLIWNWIPLEEQLPKDDNYILLSFENFSVPLVGRYDDGAFYVGDDDVACVSQGVFVNAWTPLPEPYKED